MNDFVHDRYHTFEKILEKVEQLTMDLQSKTEFGSEILQRATATESGSHNAELTLEQQDLRKAGFKEDTIAEILKIFEVDPDYPSAHDMATEYIESRQVDPYAFSMENIAKLGFTDSKTELLFRLLQEQDEDKSMPCDSVIEIAVESILFLRYPSGVEFVETAFPNSTGEESSVESSSGGQDQYIQKDGFRYKRFGTVETWLEHASSENVAAESGCQYFHGTTSMFLEDINACGIEYGHCKSNRDFNINSDAFYVATEFSQACEWATRKARVQETLGKFVFPVVLGFRQTEELEELMKMDDAPKKVFHDKNELRRFIFQCRRAKGDHRLTYMKLARPILDNHVYIEGMCLNPTRMRESSDVILGGHQIAFRSARKQRIASVTWLDELNDGMQYAWIGK
eukprot:m.166765 g.166765  ORF g.166765 m.166765 type:complete len:398 (-) comp18168_c0_seq1:255-1448(-)